MSLISKDTKKFSEHSVHLKRKQNILALIFIAFLVTIYTVAFNPIGATDSKQHIELIIPTKDEISRYGYPINDYGETYGPDIKGSDNSPDLMLAIGVDSKLGYIRPSEMPGTSIHTPEEAVAYNLHSGRNATVPLYMQDGQTIIGEFQLG